MTARKRPAAGRRAIAVSAVFLLTGLPAAFTMGSHRDTTLSELGDVVDSGRVLVLRPEQ